MAALMRATAGTSPVDEIHHLTPDLTEKVTRCGMPDKVPAPGSSHCATARTMSVRSSRASRPSAVCKKLIPIDHGLMVSEPKRLAEILIERGGRYS